MPLARSEICSFAVGSPSHAPYWSAPIAQRLAGRVDGHTLAPITCVWLENCDRVDRPHVDAEPLDRKHSRRIAGRAVDDVRLDRVESMRGAALAWRGATRSRERRAAQRLIFSALRGVNSSCEVERACTRGRPRLAPPRVYSAAAASAEAARLRSRRWHGLGPHQVRRRRLPPRPLPWFARRRPAWLASIPRAAGSAAAAAVAAVSRRRRRRRSRAWRCAWAAGSS